MIFSRFFRVDGFRGVFRGVFVVEDGIFLGFGVRRSRGVFSVGRDLGSRVGFFVYSGGLAMF